VEEAAAAIAEPSAAVARHGVGGTGEDDDGCELHDRSGVKEDDSNTKLERSGRLAVELGILNSRFYRQL
jgi:hypothetical protein